MIGLLAPLSDVQHKLLELVSTVERQFDGQRPLWYWIEHQFARCGQDARAVLDSLPRVGASGPSNRNYGLVWFDRPFPVHDSEIYLTIAGRYHVNDASEKQRLADFVVILEALVGYRKQHELSPVTYTEVQLDGAKFTQLVKGLPPTWTTIFPAYVAKEPVFIASSMHYGSAPQSNWAMSQLTLDFLLYEGIDTIEQYVNRVAELLTPEPVAPQPAVPSPLDLVTAFDYLNVVWQLHFDRPLVQPLNGERTARLAFDAVTMDELSSQVNSVAEILKNLRIPTQHVPKSTPIQQLLPFLIDQLTAEPATIERVAGAIEVFETITYLRNSLQHTGTEYRGAGALPRLGLDFPISHPAWAWQQIQSRLIDALTVLREEIHANHTVPERR